MTEPERKPRTRRWAVGITTSGAAVMVVAGVSFACIPWKGEMTVDPVPPGQSAVTVHGNPPPGEGVAPAGNRKWCNDTEPYAPAQLRMNDNFNLEVAPFAGSANCAANKLTKGDYEVTWVEEMFVDADASGTYDDSENTWGCHSFPETIGVSTFTLGTLTVDPSGNGSTTLTAPSTPAEAGAVCITSILSPHEGNMAPVTGVFL